MIWHTTDVLPGLEASHVPCNGSEKLDHGTLIAPFLCSPRLLLWCACFDTHQPQANGSNEQPTDRSQQGGHFLPRKTGRCHLYLESMTTKLGAICSLILAMGYSRRPVTGQQRPRNPPRQRLSHRRRHLRCQPRQVDPSLRVRLDVQAWAERRPAILRCMVRPLL